MTNARTFIGVLHSDVAAADGAGKLGLDGQFVGGWETDIITYGPTARATRATVRSTSGGFSKAVPSRMSG
jgi:hypothetical protein